MMFVIIQRKHKEFISENMLGRGDLIGYDYILLHLQINFLLSLVLEEGTVTRMRLY